MILDRSQSIRGSVAEVQFTLMLAVALVVMVIFLFLRSLTATIIPALALPISLIGTFAGMYLLGYSIDNLSLLALTLSVGFVVDDAIVMLENIVRHVENGERPFQAALRGSREIGFTIISITLSLVAVFIPVLFMGGIVGRLFREFAVTISMTILISGFVSLTLTPLLCSRLLRPVEPGREPAGEHQSGRLFDRVRRLYERTLGVALGHRRAMLAFTLMTLVATLYLYGAVPKGFFPTEDTGMLIVTTEAGQDISFDGMSAAQRQVAKIIQADPAVDRGQLDGRHRRAERRDQFRPHVRRAEAARSARRQRRRELIQRLRAKLAHLPSLNVFMQPVQNFQIGGRSAKSLYQYTLQGTDLAELQRLAPEVESGMRKLPGLQDVTSDLEVDKPEALVDINRDTAATLGVSVDDVRNTLYSAFGTRQVSTIYTATNDYEVILEVDPKHQQDANALADIYLRSSSGQLVPLSAIATIRRMAGPVTVTHQGQLPAVTLSFNLAPGVSLSQAVAEIQGMEREMRLPATISTGFQGTAQLFQDTAANQGLLLLAAIFVIYVVLGILYESFVHPITILSGLPAAGLGALIALMTVRHGPGRDRDHRHRDADRHRQEERDHDDRLRDRAPAEHRCDPRAGDLRGLPAALPADHDDHHGGDPGCLADRDRLRRRLRAQAAARRRGGRRPLVLAAPDALHHAGDLPLPRAGPRRIRPLARPRAGGPGAGRGADPAARRDRPAGDPPRLLTAGTLQAWPSTGGTGVAMGDACATEFAGVLTTGS